MMTKGTSFIPDFLSDFINEIKINQSEYLTCGNGSNLTCDDQWPTNRDSHKRSIWSDVFTYVTPVIFAVRITRNTISSLVFLTKNMRKLSASVYLAALSTADLMALVFYVLVEWIRKGIPIGSRQVYVTAPFFESNGVCQIILFMSYSFRFLSAWLVACFTLERYIGVCHPLKRKDVCNLHSSKRIVFLAVIVSFVIASSRPWLSEVLYVGPNNVPSCTRRPEHTNLSFIYDCIFVVCITFLPFLVITILNTLIIRKLIIRNKRHRQVRITTKVSIIRLEFTIILITISFCLIAFNTPYAIIWFKHSLQMSLIQIEDSVFVPTNQNLLIFTKTILFINYCINFFLYSITGAYFREELKMLFTYRSKVYQSFHKCPLPNSPGTTPQSWVA